MKQKESTPKKKPMSRGLLAVIILILVVAVGVLGFSLYKLIGIGQSYKEANDLYADLALQMAEAGETKASEGTAEAQTPGNTGNVQETSADLQDIQPPDPVEAVHQDLPAEEPHETTPDTPETPGTEETITQTFSEHTVYAQGTARAGSELNWQPHYESATFDPGRVTAFSDFGRASMPWNFKALHDRYPDAVGWIYQEGTMSYPIVQADDNDKYLRHMINGEYNVAGTIFVDYIFEQGLNGRYSILYGHNMDDKSMFGTLTDYKEESWYQEHPYMEFYIGENLYRYHVYAAFQTEVDSRLFTDDHMSDEEFLDLVQWIDEQKLYETKAPKITENSVVTVLSTCIDYPRNYDFRYIVVLVRESQLAKYKKPIDTIGE